MIINESDAGIYQSLFSHADKELQRNNQAFKCKEEVFLHALGASPKNIDFEQFTGLEGEALLECLFLVLFQRVPSDKDREKCEGKDAKSIVSYAVNKASFSVRGLSLVNCPYPAKPGLKGKLFSILSAVSASASLRRFAKKMPRGLQSVIRGIFA